MQLFRWPLCLLALCSGILVTILNATDNSAYARATMIGDRCIPGFIPLLEPFGIADFENSQDTIYGITPDLKLAYLNPAWFHFSKHNNGEPAISKQWTLGRSVMDCVPDALRAFYVTLYQSAFSKGRHTGHPVQHRYECSSPDVFRNLLMTLYPLDETRGILVVNSTVVEVSHESMGKELQNPAVSRYVKENGFIRMCANCRRTQNVHEENRWDWVPALVADPPSSVSHGLCNLCLTYYYGDEMASVSSGKTEG